MTSGKSSRNAVAPPVHFMTAADVDDDEQRRKMSTNTVRKKSSGDLDNNMLPSSNDRGGRDFRAIVISSVFYRVLVVNTEQFFFCFFCNFKHVKPGTSLTRFRFWNALGTRVTIFDSASVNSKSREMSTVYSIGKTVFERVEPTHRKRFGRIILSFYFYT